MTDNTASLPPVVAAHIAAVNAHDEDAVVATFAAGALVNDAHREFWGTEAIRSWAGRSGLTDFSVEVLTLAFLSWTRLHGIISLELGGHLAATGVGAAVLFEAEVAALRSRAERLPPARRGD